MPKLTVTEAEKLVSVGKSTIYTDMDTGKLAFDLNARGKKVIDPAELDRVYGLLKHPEINGNPTISENGTSRTQMETSGNGNGTSRTHSEISANTDAGMGDVRFLQSEVERLKAELEAAGKREAKRLEREEQLETRAEKLLDMLAMEQEKTKMLMLPQGAPERIKKKGRWFGYFRRKR
ncbi:MAG: hypothetical protein OXG97_06635 [Candidatus Poribacteria bacterium]|nr:hypothetical protein [Candidatus Poribacteria bacterium]